MDLIEISVSDVNFLEKLKISLDGKKKIHILGECSSDVLKSIGEAQREYSKKQMEKGNYRSVSYITYLNKGVINHEFNF